ncbi:hypothetical protein GWI33_016236 [Rhynchophorus ferrugineus]|uniref:Uncharacterized protein n=1 Tax=Rhynchophorus ferrugineus TaxID=354439 RepID=A0A834I0I8_RHYFE|nr:hypothetical protein GWI33_016236 [Rhynchophorus ferrugineus]
MVTSTNIDYDERIDDLRIEMSELRKSFAPSKPEQGKLTEDMGMKSAADIIDDEGFTIPTSKRKRRSLLNDLPEKTGIQQQRRNNHLRYRGYSHPQ